MEIKLSFILLLLLMMMMMIMETCLASNSMAFHGSAESSSQRRILLEPATTHPTVPTQPSSKGHTSSHVSPLSFGKKRHGRKKSAHHKWIPAIAANPHITADSPPSIALPPSISPSREPTKKWAHGTISVPSISYHKHHHHHHRQAHHQQGSSISPSQSPIRSSRIWSSPASAPVEPPTASSDQYNMPSLPPSVSPMGSILKKTHSPSSPLLALPPPPPNTDCGSVTCTEPLTYTPAGSPCGCVLPIEVKLHLDTAIYAFFPLVSVLTEEISASIGLNHSQVRIMGADAASRQLEKTAVIINLVPGGAKFDPSTAFRIYDMFWRRQVLIDTLQFGKYEVLYVNYPGLPPSPPPSPLGISTADDGPYGGRNGGVMPMKPLGVDVSRRDRNGLGKRMIAVIVVSSFTAFVVLLGISWLLLSKFRSRNQQDIPQPLISSAPKTTVGVARPTPQDSGRGSRESVSLSSGTMTYTGSAKIFTLSEIEQATSNFEASRLLGEGGFGLVYRGKLEDGREIAVKILKRDDHHSGREFMAEVEMLSRLHHRNLVKLIGICTEGHTRCLIYELVPNGSVESHLHGVDKESDPLDWEARMKIALGAARGLAYLHEDSNPRVIHRDFKSSNILLEHDFTPKVSDFGLARAALDGNRHISTHVMGTFGYLAPEYAMTGHLLVKSDVYSYGVVLLELLTGRKPVDLTQPPGQENLVAWTRPLLTNKEGLEAIIDPSIKAEIGSWDSIAKLAAIASMCVQPEVSHRPFMGEVVQALKLVCSELDETKGLASRSYSRDDFGDKNGTGLPVSGQITSTLLLQEEAVSSRSNDFVSCPSQHDNNTGDLLHGPQMGIEEQDLGSFRRFSSSGPLASGPGQRRRFWQRLRSLSWGGGTSDHGLPGKFWSGSR